MNLRTIWSFVAGDSKFAPLGVLVAVIVTLGLVRYAPASGGAIGIVFVAIVACGLIAGVFEKV